jgi:type I restriction enzyme S subunit
MSGQPKELTIGDVCDVIRPKKTKELHQVLTFKGLHADGSLHLAEVEHGQFAVANAGDIVFTKQGHIAGWAMKKIGIVTGTNPVHVAGTLQVIRPRPGLNSRYLYYWLSRRATYDYVLHELAGRAGITDAVLKAIPIVVVPTSQQEQIVRLLDEAFEGIAIAKANVEKNLLNARALFRGYLNSAFLEDNNHWQTKDFEDCIQPVQYTRKVQRKQFLSEGKFPIISQEADFNNGFWNDKADLFEVVRPVVIFGDHTRVLKYVDFSFVLGADGVRILSPHEFLNPKFFYYQLLGTDIRSLGYSRHYRLLKEIKIRFPSLEEQARVVSRLDEIAHQSQKLAETYAQKLAALELLRESILGQSLMDSLKAA